MINLLLSLILFNCYLFSQECPSDYTYYNEFPGNVTNINNDDNCFFDDDIEVLNTFISLNELNYDSQFDLGIQTWVTSRLVSWVATYIPSGQNGLTQKVEQIPDNIGQLTQLEYLFIEKHNLSTLPDSFTELSSLIYLGISNNYLITLPENFGNLINLETLDLGYNQLESIPESIGSLINLVYLFLFNNQLTALPETICNLNLDWDGISSSNYPYFASGGNFLCDSESVPDCVESSSNFNISMEQNYYSFLLESPQICPGCTDENANNYDPNATMDDGSCEYCPSLGDLNGDGTFNVLDIVTLANCVLAQNCANLDYGCAGDMNSDGTWNVLDIVTLANCVLAQNCGS